MFTKVGPVGIAVFKQIQNATVVRELNLMTVKRKVLLRESEQYKQSLSAGIT